MRLLIIITVFSFLFSSCDRDDITTFDENRNNIVGMWEVTQVTQEIRDGSVHLEQSTTFDIIFNQDGTGMQPVLGTDVAIEWTYQYNPQKVVINGVKGGTISLASVQFYKVIKNEMEMQIWEFEIIPIFGIVDKYKHTWNMERK